MTRNQVTEVTFLARIPALPDHVKKPAGRELWVLLQGVQNERKIGIDHGAPDHRGLFQRLKLNNPANGRMMDIQLGCDRSERPFIAVVKPLNFCGEIVVEGHGVPFF